MGQTSLGSIFAARFPDLLHRQGAEDCRACDPGLSCLGIPEFCRARRPVYDEGMSRRSPTTATLELDGERLTLADARRILNGQVGDLLLATAARRRVADSRDCVMRLLDQRETTYGVKPGFGKLSGQRIGPGEVLQLQENLLRSHAVGFGPLLGLAVSRLALALRIQALAKGYSGVTPGLIDALQEVYNRGVVPAVPEQGSVGASGDLAPLAHLALVVMGEGQAFVTRPGPHAGANGHPAGKRPRLRSGRAALRQVHLSPYRPQAKEGLSLINGTQVSTALLADALVHARQLLRVADVAGAMTVEATRSSLRPFDPRIQQARP